MSEYARNQNTGYPSKAIQKTDVIFFALRDGEVIFFHTLFAIIVRNGRLNTSRFVKGTIFYELQTNAAYGIAIAQGEWGWSEAMVSNFS